VLLLIPFALALVVVSLLGLAGIGPLSSERVEARSGLLGGMGAAIGLAIGLGVVVLNVVAFAVLVGVGGDDEGDAPRERRSATATTVPPRIASPAATSRAATTDRTVRLHPATTESFPAPGAVADRLPRKAVLDVRVQGFAPFARAVAEQCVSLVALACGNRIPVQFGESGRAWFQYGVTDDFLVPAVPGGCRVGAPRCTLVVRAGDEGRRAEIETVFVDRVPPPGRVVVVPHRPLSLEGETVTVRVERFPPGVKGAAVLCAAPAVSGPRCGAPGPSAPLQVGADGTGRTRLRVVPGEVGASGARCERGDECGVSVVVPGVATRARVAPVSFAAPPGADYDRSRLLIGLAVAAVLVAIAAVLIRRGDWAAVGEAAAPEIDDADYADLDAIIAALPPEEDDLVSATRSP
jgi:hypothetical protein